MKKAAWDVFQLIGRLSVQSKNKILVPIVIDFLASQIEQSVALASKKISPGTPGQHSPIITDLQIQSISFLHSLAVNEMKSSFSTGVVMEITKNLSKLFHAVCF